jgi:antitoxin VapB
MESMMAFHVRDGEADLLVRRLARKTGLTITDAIKAAAAEKLARIEKAEAAIDGRPVLERIRDIQDRIASQPDTGRKANKAFYDSLYGDE